MDESTFINFTLYLLKLTDFPLKKSSLTFNRYIKEKNYLKISSSIRKRM